MPVAVSKPLTPILSKRFRTRAMTHNPRKKPKTGRRSSIDGVADGFFGWEPFQSGGRVISEAMEARVGLERYCLVEKRTPTALRRAGEGGKLTGT